MKKNQTEKMLYYAAANNLDTVQALLKYNAKLSRDKYGMTVCC